LRVVHIAAFCVVALVAASAPSPALAQFAGAATVADGSSCTAGWFAWPDPSGRALICVGGVYQAVSTSSQWINSGSNIFYNGGNVGIGTTGPQHLLTVVDTANADNLWVESNNNNASLTLNDTASGGREWRISSGATASITPASFAIQDVTASNAIRLSINSSGNVGIGTTIPLTNLHLAGSTPIETIQDTGAGGIYGSFGSSGGYVGLGVNRNWATGSIYNSSAATASIGAYAGSGSSYIFFATTNTNNASPTTAMTIAGNGNVGIGTATFRNNSADLLEVYGTAAADWIEVDTNSTGHDAAHASYDGTNLVASGLLNGETCGAGNWAVYAGGCRMAIMQSGNVGIGTASALMSNTLLSLNGSGGVGTGVLGMVNSGSPTKIWQTGPDSNGSYVVFDNASAGMYMAYGATAWTANSDRRIKTNIHTLTNEQGLAAIEQLNPVTFHWRDPKALQTTQVGVIAQDVQKVLPDLVNVGAPTSYTPDGTLGVEYTGLIPPLIKAVQELKSLFDADHVALAKLKADNDNEAAEIKTLTTRLEALEAARR
jgi:trimeric autotransporter adhesin